MKQRNLSSIAAWARSIGVSRQAGRSAVQRLGIPLHDGQVDAAEATAIYNAKSRPYVRSQPSRQVAQAPAEYGAAAVAQQEYAHDLKHWRTRNERAKALQEEISLAERQQRFVEVGPLVEILQRQMAVLRTLLLAVPSRIAQEVAGDHHHKAEVFDIACRLQEEALEALHDGPLAGLEAQAAALEKA